MAKRAYWESCNHTFAVLIHTRPEIALDYFVKCVEGAMVAADWVSVECNNNNIAHRLSYHPEVDVFNVIFKYFLHIKDDMCKGKVALAIHLAVDRVKFVQI